jgi:hypothetical protein
LSTTNGTKVVRAVGVLTAFALFIQKHFDDRILSSAIAKHILPQLAFLTRPPLCPYTRPVRGVFTVWTRFLLASAFFGRFQDNGAVHEKQA